MLPYRPPKKYKLIPRTIKRNGGGKVISIDDDRNDSDDNDESQMSERLDKR